jgi:trehalose 6-phosphate synthase
MQRTNGVWVAWGSGSADHETADAHGRLMVPPDTPHYTLRRVWLSDADIEGYYLGFANSVLWPLCHMLIQHLDFHTEHWDRYRSVNDDFARAVCEEIARCKQTPVVWFQDYHLALAPSRVRAQCPGLLLHHFWHIPFPPPDIFRLIPVSAPEALLRGLLGNDLIEFQTERAARNFLECVAEFVPDADVDRDGLTVHYEGRTVHVGAFPISIDVAEYERLADLPAAREQAAVLRERYACDDRVLGVSVDRIDYTKGIPERLRALEQLWEQYPDLRGRLTMLFVATPSRSELPVYRELEADVVRGVMEINERFRTETWTPIVLVHENVDSNLLAAVYRAADLCLVSSIQDGMNLVAKEFVACQLEERGVLVLSRFTGAAEEIDGAVFINPFNVEGFAEGIRQAIQMSPEERRARMHAMREQLKKATIVEWLDTILTRTDQLVGLTTADRT